LEETMHIHANLMNPQAAGPYDPSARRAEQAERAAQTRRKLQKASETITASDLDTPDAGAAGLLVRNWLNAGPNPSLAEDNYTPAPESHDFFPG
jgi:hypothetical protein